jgi:hypothetical protein
MAQDFVQSTGIDPLKDATIRGVREATNPRLDNFEGIISVRVRIAGGNDLPIGHYNLRDPGDGQGVPIEVEGVLLPPSSNGEVIVRFERPEDAVQNSFYDRIAITSGNPRKTVTFDVGVDSRSITFAPNRASSTFWANSRSPHLSFAFKTPTRPGKHDLFVEVSQKNRLIQVVPVSIVVAGDQG